MSTKKSFREQPGHQYQSTSGLSTHTLLATLIGGRNAYATAEGLLSRFGDGPSLYRATISELAEVQGVSQATAARIKAGLELGRRDYPVECDEIHCPADAAALLKDMAWLPQEQVRVILLNSRNKVIDIILVYQGTVNANQVRVGELFREAVRLNAATIVLAHNHPSGDPLPSPEDAALTRAAVQAGKLLDIDVLDHLVIGHPGWKSLKEMGLGFS